ncbi:MAG: Rne/Rng family ribonuclease [Proteobacteria bacterium]|nr:Rne/Rng family ribonuclease [Pseudomonadota bacterium]
MARRMLIDASHPEETRVVVVDGTRLEEFDFETASRKPLKGNIYLAKVIRIEPSLQAAFVEYGGNRHGFLAFSEIHPDYYQIPVADRERLIAEQQRLHDDEDEEPRRRGRVDRTDIEEVREENFAELGAVVAEAPIVPPADSDNETPAHAADDEAPAPVDAAPEPMAVEPAVAEAPTETPAETPEPQTQAAAIPSERLDGPAEEASPEGTPLETATTEAAGDATAADPSADPSEAPQPEVSVETLGGDDVIEQRETRERRRRNPIRQYKIQEVIKRRQILLVQVVKEERGNKGAALTTYLSLAGRYSVLMPNAGRGGGISRKISNPADRKRMKEVLSELDVPQGQGVILRTAGLERSTSDIKRDYEYLSRLWDSIREITMRSTAPALIYEEGDLIKRSLRDVYDTDIAQVLVEGEAGFQAASEFMRQLVPHQASKVEAYKDPIPLFHRYQVESQFDAMHSPVVQLRSGGYIVINPTEALVAIDVNSGRSTKERNIEETALRTNLEAAEEVARQVRLRDLAGLIVIDFIDMEETRHQRQVEHKVKDAMRHDRARIQIGRISAFGLLEMSRQRLRPSLLEHSTEICPHCAGTGRVRSIESAALHALRAIEEEGVRRRAGEIVVSVPPNVALYLLNQKRHTLSEVENRYGFTVTVEADDELHAADCEIERVRTRRDDRDRPAPETARASYQEVSEEAASEVEDGEDTEREAGGEERAEDDGDRDGSRRRRRRRRRRGRRDEEGDGERSQAQGADDERREERGERSADREGDREEGREGPAENGHDRAAGEAGDDEAREDVAADGEREDRGEGGDRRRRRGRRGGRRRRRENGEGEFPESGEAGDAPAHAAESANGEAPALPVDGQPVEHTSFEPAPVEAPVAPPVNVEAEPPVVAAAPQPAVVPEPVPEPAPVATPEPAPEPVVPAITAPPEKPKRGWWSR